jgi:hypothetical protein
MVGSGMKEAVSRAIFIKRIMISVAVSCCCLIVPSVFARELAAELSAGEDIFVPGATVLVVGVALILAVSVRCLIKNLRRCAGKE